MKEKPVYYLFLLLLPVLIVSCKPKVLFKKPLPKRIKNTAILPENYQGKYLDIKDSAVLTIDSLLITREEFNINFMTRKELYEEIDTIIEHDTTVIEDNWRIEIKIFGDSASFSTYISDTLFNIQEKGLVKEYNGYLFLNRLSENQYWQVFIIRQDGDSLLYSPFLRSADIDTARTITKVKDIRDPEDEEKIQEYHLNPSNRQINKLLDLCSSKYNYIRIQDNTM